MRRRCACVWLVKERIILQTNFVTDGRSKNVFKRDRPKSRKKETESQSDRLPQCCPVLVKERRGEVKKQKEQEKSIVMQQQEQRKDSVGGVCFSITTKSDVPIAEKWIIDTGCTKHMTNSVASFGWWNPCAKEMSLADGKTVKVRGRGQGRIIGVGLDGRAIEVKLKDLQFVPGLSTNVLSVSRITDQGLCVQFGPKECRILDGSEVIAIGEKSGGSYYLKQ